VEDICRIFCGALGEDFPFYEIRKRRLDYYVKSTRAGQRVLASVTRFLGRRLKLVVNAAKSAVDRPWRRTVSGLHVHGAPAEPAPGEREGPGGVHARGAPFDISDT
jgi:hypothetical protein